MKPLSENSSVNINVKMIGFMIVIVSSVVGGWFNLKAEIREAKKLPEPIMTEQEFILREQLLQQAIFQTQQDISKIEKSIQRIEKKLR
tara:strand:+ start:1751 stop:2014 length:264 start_codon:yes stop_codon:yes gene_type:complete